MRKKILSFQDYLLEALRDEITPHHIDRINHYKADKLLDLDVPKKTDLIVEGRWTLTSDEKDEVISSYFGMDYENASKELARFNCDDNFIEIIRSAYLRNDEHELGNIKKPSLIDIKFLYEKNTFKIISAGETKDDKRIVRDATGIPMMDENNVIIKEPKEVGEIVWSSNKGSINDFITAYKSAFTKDFYNPYAGAVLSSIPGRMTKELFDINLFGKFDLHLYITGKAQDMLNQSMTKFYQSCQTLYREEKGFSDLKPLMANLFDKNTKICYLIFDTPWTDHHNKTYPFTAFSRMFIRLVNGKIFFDYVYPSSIKNFLHRVVEKYNGMKNEYGENRGEYKYSTPDPYAQHSYMDILYPSWKKEISIEELLKDPKLRTLSEFLKIEPNDIDNPSKDIYVTPKGAYTILGKGELEHREEKRNNEYQDKLERFNKQVNDDILKHIKDMVYKQDVYKDFVDYRTFEEREKNGFLKNYQGDINFDSISKWAEENKISKHNLYRAMKPYLRQEFWDSKLTEKNIEKRKNSYLEENKDKIPQPLKPEFSEKVDIGNELFACK